MSRLRMEIIRMGETLSGQKMIGTKTFGVVELPCLCLTFDGDLLIVLICFKTQQVIKEFIMRCDSISIIIVLKN